MVKVRLTSPKLCFPEGDQVITVTESSPPFRVPVEAKSNGTFQVTATLLTPQGDAPLGAADGHHRAVDGAVGLGHPGDHRRRTRARRVVVPAPAVQAPPAAPAPPPRSAIPASPVEPDHLPI